MKWTEKLTQGSSPTPKVKLSEQQINNTVLKCTLKHKIDAYDPTPTQMKDE